MGWFEILSLGLDVVQIGVLSQQSSTLKGMNERQLAGALQKEILEIFKNLVFASNKSAEALTEQLEHEAQKVYVLARLLQFRLANYNITPDIFPEFGDKEYVSQTQKTISALIKESQLKLDETELQDAEACVETVKQMPGLNEAIAVQSDRVRAAEIQAQVREIDKVWKPLESRGKQRKLIGIGLAVGGPMLSCVCFMTATAVGAVLQDISSGLGSLFAIIMIGAPLLLFAGGVIGAIYLLSRPISKEHAELTQKRALLLGQMPKSDPNKVISANYQGQSLSELEALRDTHQRFIQRIMGDADEDYDYDMVFLEE
jgi:hypothetical protein